MRSWLIGLAMIVVLGAMGGAIVQAAAPRVGANPIGKPITVYGEDRKEAATITLVKLVDPFDDYSEFGGPSADQRDVLAVIEVEVTGKRPYAFTPYNFLVMDEIGHLASYGFASRSDASTVETPDLEEGNLLPGESTTGAIVFSVAEDAELTQLVYTGYADVQFLYLVADLTADE